MPALIPTSYSGKITWLGLVGPGTEGIRSAPRDSVFAGFAGVDGETHGGLTREACSRTLAQHPKGTEIANVRQFSVLSAEDIAAIAAGIGLETLAPEMLGASIVIEGIEDFSHLPPSSRLQNEAGTTLVIDMQNRPCVWPGKEIEKDHPGIGRLFKSAAEGHRGVTAWVEREGPLSVGDMMRLHVPDQRPWSLADTARQS